MMRCLFLVVVIAGQVWGGCVRDQLNVTSTIFQRYDRFEPPEWKSGKPTEVKVSATVTKINEFSTREQTFHINMYFRESWVDSRLTWSPSDFCGVSVLPDLPGSKFWVPDSFFANANEIKTPDQEEYVQVDNSGTVLWSKRIVLTLFCAMDFTYYPFDRQNCQTQIESYAHSPAILKYVFPDKSDRFPKVIELLNENVGSVGAYNLHEPWAEVKDTVISGNAFSSVVFHWEFQRQRARYFLTAFLPIWLVVGMSFLGCWVNPDAAPARVALALLAVLTLINLMFKLTQEIPVVPYLTAMDILYVICIIVVVGNVLEYCLVNYCLTSLKKQENAVAELKRRRGAGSTPAYCQGGQITKQDMSCAEAELHEVFKVFDPKRTGRVPTSQLRYLIHSIAADRGRRVPDDLIDEVCKDAGKDTSFDSFCEIALGYGSRVAEELALDVEHRSAVTICGVTIVRSSVEKFEAFYRLLIILTYVAANVIWFAVVMTQSVVWITVTVVLVVSCCVGAVVLLHRSTSDTHKHPKKFEDLPPFGNSFQMDLIESGSGL